VVGLRDNIGQTATSIVHKTCCAVRLGFYASGGPAVADLVANLDDTLFASVLANDSHVLHNLLPDRNDCSCTALCLDVMIVCSPLGVTTETFLIDICLKTCINF